MWFGKNSLASEKTFIYIEAGLLWTPCTNKFKKGAAIWIPTLRFRSDN